MATWPTECNFLTAGSEKPSLEPVRRTQFERGTPKQQQIHRQMYFEIPASYYLLTTDWDDWLQFYYGDINHGALFFDTTHPLTGAAISARLKDGQFSLSTLAQKGNYLKLDVTLEYKYAFTYPGGGGGPIE